jgi:hypothetical protein
VKPSPPPPPPARIIVAVLAFVRFVLAPMLGLAARALLYLCFAAAWVISAGSAATIVARHACREGSAPLVFLEAFTDAAFKFSICGICIFLALAAVLLFGLCLVAVLSGSGSKVKKVSCKLLL